jgi:hypothetical protein
MKQVIIPVYCKVYVLRDIHVNAALTKDGPADSEPCQVPCSCFAASVVILIGASSVRVFQVEALFLSLKASATETASGTW